MKEIGDHEELAAWCDADTLCLWAAQGLDGRSRAWRSTDGRAVAVAAPGLAARDRLTLRGPADAVASLVLEVLDQVRPDYRPLGDRRPAHLHRPRAAPSGAGRRPLDGLTAAATAPARSGGSASR